MKINMAATCQARPAIMTGGQRLAQMMQALNGWESHTVDTSVLRARATIGNGCNGTTGGLKQESHKIKGNEENAVSSRFESRELFSIDHDNSPKTEVDGSCYEGRGDGQTDDVAIASRSAREFDSFNLIDPHVRNGPSGNGLKCI